MHSPTWGSISTALAWGGYKLHLVLHVVVLLLALPKLFWEFAQQAKPIHTPQKINYAQHMSAQHAQ